MKASGIVHNRFAMRPQSNPSAPSQRWDIFCRIIDNYGDVGTCWRLSMDLAGRGHRVRLFLDDLEALAWMAPGSHPGVEVAHWDRDGPAELGDVVVAAFSCDLDEVTLRALGARHHAGRPCAWIQLEYLSAETFSARAHGCAAPVLGGPAAGAPRFAYYPGFTSETGGLLREPDLQRRQKSFQASNWLAAQGLSWQGQTLISLFCYQPARLAEVLTQLADSDQPVLLLVCAGRGAVAVRHALGAGSRTAATPDLTRGNLSVSFLPALAQIEYDHLLWACDLNFVRGEDSLVRAIWAGRPFIWNAYPQQDGAHHAKIQALMDAMQADASLRRFSKAWNESEATCEKLDQPLSELVQWQRGARAWQDALLEQTDLSSRLLEFVSKTG